MTREQYETLPLSELKELARFRKIKGCSTLRKAGLIDRMLEEDEKLEMKSVKEEEEKPVEKPRKPRAKRSKKAETEGPIQEETGIEPVLNEEIVKAGALTVETDKEENTDETSDKVYEELKKESALNEEEKPEKKRPGRKSTGATKRTVPVKERKTENKKPAEETEIGKEEAEVVQDSKQESTEKPETAEKHENSKLDSGQTVEGILEVMPEGFGFIRSDNFLPGENDVYVSPSQIRRFGLKTGDVLRGNTRIKMQNEKFSALLYVHSVNDLNPQEASKRRNFEDLTPIFPDQRIKLEQQGSSISMRIVDLLSPIGKGQRGMIVSPPKAGKTTLLKEMALSILKKYPEMHIMILLIDERPEEVTDMKETVYGPNVEVIYSTFDELPDHHRRVSEMVIERAKRLVESKRDVIIFIDSITRLARAYNQVVQSSGRTLSGGLDPSALHMPKRFFGAARNIREGGSLTILATALVDTGSKMDDVVYEEFKGTGNMELVLDRKLQERRIFPAIDIVKSGTRREDLLLSRQEIETINKMRRALNGLRSEEATENILNMFLHTRNNGELINQVMKTKML